MTTRGQDIVSQTKATIFSVYNYLKGLVNSAPNMTVWEALHQTQKATAEACSVSLRTVQNIMKEGKKTQDVVGRDVNEEPEPDLTKHNETMFSSPRRKRTHKKWITDIDEFDRDVVRRTVLEAYDRGEYPTCKRLKEELMEKIGFSGSAKSICRILKDLGFKFKKCNDGRKFLMERTDIIASRVAFLRKMHLVRQEENPRPIIYLDETWVNQNHSKHYIWQGPGGEGGHRVPIGKGARLILCHAGSSQHGFIENAQLLFQSKNKGNYHQQMDHTVFEEWFIELLRSLEEGCVIVMDNASYHSEQIDKVPSTKTKKAEIIKWLSDNGIIHNPNHTMVELLVNVRQNRDRFPRRYKLDEIALQMGHEVVRLPPYHCQYNPIELIWAQVKGEVATKNSTYKISDVRTLLENAVKNISKEDWEKCVKHAEKLQEDDFVKEGLRDEIMERIIVNLEEESDTDTLSEGPNSDDED